MNANSAEPIIEIAGAGPAGLASAITLAYAGRRVVVHEMRKEVGARFGQDFQGLENWSTEKDVLSSLRDYGLTNAFTSLPCCSGIAFDANETSYHINTDIPFFYLIERGPGPGALDTELLNQALELGVEVRFNSRLRQKTSNSIFATGPHVADAIAVGYHFDTDMQNGYWIICNDDLAPKGYAYLLVMNGRGTMKK